MSIVLAQQRAENLKLTREIVTPEGVPIRFQLARAGDRVGGFCIDMAIQIASMIAIGMLLQLTLGHSLAGNWLTAIIVVIAFLLLTFYFAFFETRWQGSTPGKRRVGIRVIDARGGQLETSAVLARNLVRELEVWMPVRFLLAGRVVWPGAPTWAFMLAGAWTFVFLLFPLFNKDRLRIGDIIAGTRVVMQPKLVLVPDLITEAQQQAQFRPRHAPPKQSYTFAEQHLGFYGIYELQVLEGVLRQDPTTQGFQDAITTVTEKITAKIGYTTPISDTEQFLRDFYAAQRAHLEQKMLFGQRREDKFSKK
jgi:uncharacterized RDD family membrane protein YckC